MLYSIHIIWIWRMMILLITMSVSESSRNESESESEFKLLMASYSAVYVMDMETSEKLKLNTGTARGVDYDIERKLIIWSDVASDKIYSINMNGEDKKIIAEYYIMIPSGLSVDWIYGNVYWTDTGIDTINVASLDGKLRKVLIKIDVYGAEPEAIAVSPLEGWMFWSESGVRPKIVRSGMDGTHQSTIISEGVVWPYGLAIDRDSKTIFWIDARVDNLKSANYDGSNVKVILSSPSEIVDPYGLDIFQDSIYWSDWRKASIHKVDRITGESIETIATDYGSIKGIRIVHRSKQPRGTNYCQESGECTHWCFPAPRLTEYSKKFTCACSNGMVLTEDKKNCTSVSKRYGYDQWCEYGDPYFKCDNNKCIRRSWVCDGDNDCLDNSDERNCSYGYTSTSRISPPATLTTTDGYTATSRTTPPATLTTTETFHPTTETVTYEEHETISYPTELSTSTDITVNIFNETISEIDDESDDVDNIVGIVIGIIALIVLMSAVGVYVYKQRLRRNIADRKNPVYQKQIDEKLESKSTKERVILNI